MKDMSRFLDKVVRESALPSITQGRLEREYPERESGRTRETSVFIKRYCFFILRTTLFIGCGGFGWTRSRVGWL